MNPDTYIPFAMRMDVPEKYRGPNAVLPIQPDKIVNNKPTRTNNNSLANRNMLRNKNIKNKITIGTLLNTEKQLNSNPDSNDSGENSQNKKSNESNGKENTLNNQNNGYDTYPNE